MSVSMKNHEDRIKSLENKMTELSNQSYGHWRKLGDMTRTGQTVTVPSTAKEILLIGYDNGFGGQMTMSMVVPVEYNRRPIIHNGQIGGICPRIKYDPNTRVVQLWDGYDNNYMEVWYR